MVVRQERFASCDVPQEEMGEDELALLQSPATPGEQSGSSGSSEEVHHCPRGCGFTTPKRKGLGGHARVCRLRGVASAEEQEVEVIEVEVEAVVAPRAAPLPASRP